MRRFAFGMIRVYSLLPQRVVEKVDVKSFQSHADGTRQIEWWGSHLAFLVVSSAPTLQHTSAAALNWSQSCCDSNRDLA